MEQTIYTKDMFVNKTEEPEFCLMRLSLSSRALFDTHVNL